MLFYLERRSRPSAEMSGRDRGIREADVTSPAGGLLRDQAHLSRGKEFNVIGWGGLLVTELADL